MNDEIRSMLAGTAGLSVVAAIAAWLTFARRLRGDRSSSLRTVVPVAAFALCCQVIHVGEELRAGFPQQFPVLLGLAPWSVRFFIGFNTFWIVVWALSCWGALTGFQIALLPLWFLGLASCVNGLAHPLLALREGGYFPGLVTSPLVGVAGVLLVRRLLLATAGPGFQT